MKILGLVLIIIALLAAILPQFMTCQYQGRQITLSNGNTMPMKCNWTAKAEIAVAVPLLGIGSIYALTRRKESLLSLAIIGIVLGIFTILIPTNLIGVCQTNMLCNTAMKPLLIIVGSLAILLNLFGLINSLKSRVIRK